MKKLYTLIALILIALTNIDAKIWRVNNNSGITADFTTAQAAHDAASAGDTIHLEPSGNSYGNLIMTKRLVLISSGNFITQNPGFQVQSNSGFISRLTISNAGANGSVIMVKFSSDINLNSNIGNILLQNCVCTYSDPINYGGYSDLGRINLNNADNIIIKNCFVNNINMTNNCNNIIIVNNIIANTIVNSSDCDGTIANNVIHAYSTNYGQGSLYNCTIDNNIFNQGVQVGFSGCLVRNNLSSNAGLPSGNGNQNNVNMATVFIDNTGGYLDNVYQLKSGSPAIAAGISGVDCGAFGGSTPFKLAVTPPIPSIYKLEVPSTPAGNTMSIKFSTRSNN